jgi:CheY-like chemotaxis protein
MRLLHEDLTESEYPIFTAQSQQFAAKTKAFPLSPHPVSRGYPGTNSSTLLNSMESPFVRVFRCISDWDNMSGTETVNQKRILLADDQEEVREIVKLLLTMDGHEVVEATNGSTALELYQQGDFDLVITDYAMPGLLGDELGKRIKRLCPAQPILMITGSLERSALQDGCVDLLLNKPFLLEDLRHAVSALFQPLAA